MRFLLIPFLFFIANFAMLWTLKAWSNYATWYRIALVVATSTGAMALTAVLMFFIMTFFN